LNHRAVRFTRGTKKLDSHRGFIIGALLIASGREGAPRDLDRLELRFRKRSATKWWRRGISQTRYFSLRRRAPMRKRERRDYAMHTVIALKLRGIRITGVILLRQ